MGKKKAFINKKKAVTYSLVYRDPTDAPDDELEDDGGQRVLAPVGGHRGARPDSDDFQGYYDEEGSVYDSEYSLMMSRSAAVHHDESYTMTEERRRELLALGFPDDGYDYLKHLRDLGRGTAQAAAGPAGRGGVAPIPEDQELDGFDVGAGGEWQEGSDSEEDFTIYDVEPTEAAAGAPQQQKRLDATALAAAAAADDGGGPGPSTSVGAGGRDAASAAAGPGPSSARAAAAAAAAAAGPSGGTRSIAGRSTVARSMATTARTHGSAVGPSVYIRAPKLVPPKADVKVVDARRLVVRPKGHDESAAAASLAEVAAMARHTELHGRRGKLYQDLDEVEQAMAAIENGNDPERGQQVEGDEWGDWLDEFVAGGGDDDGAAAAAGGSGGTAGGELDEEKDEEEEEEGGGASEEPEEEEEDADEWRMRHRRARRQPEEQRQVAEPKGSMSNQEEEEEEEEQEGEGAAAAAAATAAPPRMGGGPGAASVASSYWTRPERRDRKGALDALDSQFERLAVEYDDDEIGALDDGRYDDDEDDEEDEDGGDDADGGLGEDGDEDGGGGAARRRGGRRAQPANAAAGNCELSDFADVLDDFLTEHRAAEALEAEGLRPLQTSDDVALAASRPDPEALAATKARLAVQLAAQAAAEADDGGRGAAEPVRTIVVQEAERWDCESILSLTSNLEHHPAKIVEPQRRTGARGGGLIRLSAKTGMPVALRGGGGTAATSGGAATTAIPEEGEEGQDEDEDGSQAGGGGGFSGGGSDSEEEADGLDPALLSRRKGETAEERKARKAAVKEARRNQRTAKKEMKMMFRQQATRAQKQAAGRGAAAGSLYAIP